jgi:hypothetical protein
MGNTLRLLYKSFYNRYPVRRLRWRMFLSSFTRASLTS